MNAKRMEILGVDVNDTAVRGRVHVDFLEGLVGDEDRQRAHRAFEDRAADRATVEEAYGEIASIQEGIGLRQVLEYVTGRMEFMPGFRDFTVEMQRRNCHVVLNSTGYTVVLRAMQHLVPGISGYLGSELEFRRGSQVLSEPEVIALVDEFFIDPSHPLFAEVVIGKKVRVYRGTNGNSMKYSRLREWRDRFKPMVPDSGLAHIGDTVGSDLRCMLEVIEGGGSAFAFNYAEDLGERVREIQECTPSMPLYLIDSKAEGRAHFDHVLEAIDRYTAYRRIATVPGKR